VVAALTLVPLVASHPSRSATLAGGCLVAGVILTLIGTWQWTVVRRLRANGKRTTANAAESALHTAQVHHFVWRFTTDDGVVVEHEDLLGSLHKPAIGETAKIIYDPNDPHNARLETFAEGTLAWALFFSSGVILLGISIISGIIST